jgi:NADH-quinone oxidoreductase subunit N
LFSIFLLSLIGVPLTAGFFGKFYIFKAALDSHLVWLAVLGLLNSVVGVYYYLRIVVVMYMREPGEATESLEAPSFGIRATLWIAALGTLLLGIVPSLLLNFATASSNLPRQ